MNTLFNHYSKKALLGLISLNFSFVVAQQTQSDTLQTFTKKVEKTLTPPKTNKVYRFSEKQMLSLGQRSVGELLSRSSSVYMKNYGAGALITPSVRGAGASQTQIYWNGVNINSPSLGQTDLFLLPSIFFNQVELHLGSTSNVDGSGGIGGSLRLSNETNYNEGEKVTFIQELGSFGLNSTGIRIDISKNNFKTNTTFYNALADNNFTYRDTTQPNSPKLEQTNNSLKQMGLGQDVSYRFGRNEVEFKSLIFSSFREIAPTVGLTSNAFQEDLNKKFLFGINRLEGKSTHALKFAYVEDDNTYENPDWLYISNTKTASLSAIYNGVYYLSSEMKLKTFLLNQSDKVISDSYTEEKYRNRSAAYLLFEHELNEQMTYHASIRQEYIDSTVAPLSPSFGVLYKLNEKHNLALNAAKTFRMPTLNDLYFSFGGNPNLLPETAYNSELNYSYKNDKLTANVSVFYSEVDNWIQWAPNEFFIWEPQNIKRVRNNGAEANMNFTAFSSEKQSLDVALNYSYTKSTTIESDIEDDVALGNQLIYVPEHSVNFNVFYNYKSLSLSLMQTITDKVYVDDVNTQSISGYKPLDASLSYSFETIKFGLRVQNVFDEQYQVIKDYPMPGRAFYLTIRFNVNSL